MRWMYRFLLAILLGVSSYIAFQSWLNHLETEIEQFATVDEARPADAAIVLGAAVYRGYPSPVFRERINHAINLYHAGTVDYLIFTGGIGYGDDIAEAEAAQAYAQAAGVPAAHIFIETESTLTYDNLLQAHEIVTQNQFDTVLIVSDPLHMRRAVTMAHDVGLTAYSTPTPTSRYRTPRTQQPFLERETRYYAWYLLLRPLGIFFS
ncbi:MAG: YdcF family protein [Anaerolineales bacterium]|nr:YdcF family protein [Anaerolineales bacterium]